MNAKAVAAGRIAAAGTRGRGPRAFEPVEIPFGPPIVTEPPEFAEEACSGRAGRGR